MDTWILADARWTGNCGIGRASYEILSRLQHADYLLHGPKPLSLYNLFWQRSQLNKINASYKVFYTPGFNPVLTAPIPFVITISDLIHLQYPGKTGFLKKPFYDYLLKPSIKKAANIITVSDYSKNTICEWAEIPPEKVTVVYNGVSKHFTYDGVCHRPGYPYFLYVGNTKPHKNIHRLIHAFSLAKIDPRYKLIMTGDATHEVLTLIKHYQLDTRIVFNGQMNDKRLSEYYRGATALAIPSLYEGFGLPALEAMACGTPVMASSTTSLPEVVGDSALLLDPFRVDSITECFETLANQPLQRVDMIKKGLERSQLFSWDKTAEKVQSALTSVI